MYIHVVLMYRSWIQHQKTARKPGVSFTYTSQRRCGFDYSSCLECLLIRPLDFYIVHPFHVSRPTYDVLVLVPRSIKWGATRTPICEFPPKVLASKWHQYHGQ